MRYLSELAYSGRIAGRTDKGFYLSSGIRRIGERSGKSVNLLALGDVGGTVLMGLRLLGTGVVSQIGIYDLNEKLLRRYEREINQIWFPDGRKMPHVRILQQDELFDGSELFLCLFQFCFVADIQFVFQNIAVRITVHGLHCGVDVIFGEHGVILSFRTLPAARSRPAGNWSARWRSGQGCCGWIC